MKKRIRKKLDKIRKKYKLDKDCAETFSVEGKLYRFISGEWARFRV